MIGQTLVGSFQRRDGLALTVEAVLPAERQLGIFYKMFQVRAPHAGA